MNKSIVFSVFCFGLISSFPLRTNATQAMVVQVPAGPAFVTLPGQAEIVARNGQSLATKSLLRTSKPGRMQVILENGRQFRMGGDAKLLIAPSSVHLLKGALIGWIKKGSKNPSPFTIRTRFATASIQGTTVFIELNDNEFKVFSWEGKVKVTTRDDRVYVLDSGQQLSLDLAKKAAPVDDKRDPVNMEVDFSRARPRNKSIMNDPSLSFRRPELLNWREPYSIRKEEIDRRLKFSPLINSFPSRLETIVDIEKALGVSEPAD